MQDIENHFITNEIRNFYHEVKRSTETHIKRPAYCTNKDDVLIGSIEGKLNRWTEYSNNFEMQKIQTTTVQKGKIWKYRNNCR